MPLRELIQKLIHQLEAGRGARHLWSLTMGLAVVVLVFFYDTQQYRNFSTPEAMDSAQLARNIADGKGYTTLFIRPFSLYLVQKHNEAEHAETKHADALTTVGMDFARIKTAHPDLANPPLYPVVLAGLMKVLPFQYAIELNKTVGSENSGFQRYQPDFQIAVFNEILLLTVVVLTFFLARRLFDANVAWLSAFLTIGCEWLWRFSMSGLSTMLLLVIFLGLVWCLLRIEEVAREPQPPAKKLLGLAIAAGVLTGAGVLTRYAFGWIIISVVLFLLFFSGPRRKWHALAALGVFAMLLTPWVVRNFAVSGTPLGTAGFSIVEGTPFFSQFRLERSIQPNLPDILLLEQYGHKLLGNMSDIMTNDLPRLGGSWATLLFLTGLLMSFRGTAIRRMRYFLLMCLGTLIIVQALGRTQLWEESPVVNSENLLVLLLPLVFIYGTSLFFTFLRQMTLPLPQLRYVVVAAFAAVSCLPMTFTLFSSKPSPVAYPPYYPPDIQQIAGWMKEDELMMSDVPWAVAWYGRHQCIWLTLNAQGDFSAINNLKPVHALYLTTEMMDGKFLSDWIYGSECSWGDFITQAVLEKQIPPDFPLHNAPSGSASITSGMFLTDRERWKMGH